MALQESLRNLDRAYPNLFKLHAGNPRFKSKHAHSQTCHVCGYRSGITKNLGVREWDCPQCGAHHDRDTNAAKNILRHALEEKTKTA